MIVNILMKTALVFALIGVGYFFCCVLALTVVIPIIYSYEKWIEKRQNKEIKDCKIDRDDEYKE